MMASNDNGTTGVMDGFDLLMSNQNRKRMVASKSDAGGESPTSSLPDLNTSASVNAVPRTSPLSISGKSTSSLDDDLDSLSTASTDMVSRQSPSPPMQSQSQSQYMPREYMTPEQILNEKREILYQLGRLETKGIPVSRHFTLNDPIEEMRAELERLQLDREVDLSVRFQKRVLMTCVNGIELLNKIYDPFSLKLNGWSDSVHDSLRDYDEVLEDLHMKYRNQGIAMAPELKLLMMIGGSGVMFHMTASMFQKANVPDLQDVLRQNPGLMAQMQQATMRTAMGGGAGGMPPPQPSPPPPPPPPQQQSSPMGGGMLGNLFGNLFGGGGSMPPPPGPPQPSNIAGGGGMRGPKPMQDILRDMHKGAFANQDPVDILNDTDDDFILDDDVAPRSSPPDQTASQEQQAGAAPVAAAKKARGRKPKAATNNVVRNTVTVGL